MKSKNLVKEDLDTTEETVMVPTTKAVTAKAYTIVEVNGNFCVYSVGFNPDVPTVVDLVTVSTHSTKGEAMDKFKIEVANNLF